MADQFDPFAGSPQKQFDPFSSDPSGATRENMHERLRQSGEYKRPEPVDRPGFLDMALSDKDQLDEKFKRFEEANSRRNLFGSRIPNDPDPENPYLSRRNLPRLLNSIKASGGSEAWEQLKRGFLPPDPEDMRKRVAEGTYHTPTWDLVAGLAGLGYAGVAGTLHHALAEPGEYLTGIAAHHLDEAPNYLVQEGLPAGMARAMRTTPASPTLPQWTRGPSYYPRTGPVSPLESVATGRPPPQIPNPDHITSEMLDRIQAGQEFGVDIPMANVKGDKPAIGQREIAGKATKPFGPQSYQAAEDIRERLYGNPQRGIEGQVAQSGPAFASQFVGEGNLPGRPPPTVASSRDAAESIKATISNAATLNREVISSNEMAAASAENARRDALARSGENLEQMSRTNEAGREFPPIGGLSEAGGTVSADAKQVAERLRQRPAGSGIEEEPGFKDLYRDAEAMAQGSQFEPGTFASEQNPGFGRTLADSLRHQVSIENNAQTPNAYAAVQKLDSNRHLQFRPDEAGNSLPTDLQDVLQARRDLQVHYNQAREAGGGASTTDVRAMQYLINAFDDHVEDAMANGLFSGDPHVMDVMKQANAQFRAYARLFRPQFASDEVGNAVRRIVDRGATPEQVANMITDMGQLMDKSVPVKIVSRLREILGGDSEAFNAIKQAVLLRTRAFDKAGNVDALKTAGNMERLAFSSLGKAHFSPEQLQAIRSQAQGMRDLDGQIESMQEMTDLRKGRTEYDKRFSPGIGGQQGAVLRDIVSGQASVDDVARALFGWSQGSRLGNVEKMVDAVQKISGGPRSDAMSALRQGFAHYMVEGKNPEQRAAAIRDFLRTDLSKKLYPNRDDLDVFRRYADTMESLSIPPEAKSMAGAPIMPSAAKSAMYILGRISGSPESIRGAILRWAGTHTIGVVNDIRMASKIQKGGAGYPERIAPRSAQPSSPPSSVDDAMEEIRRAIERLSGH